MKINCKSCGHPIDVTPPDKDRTIILSDPCPKGDSVGVVVQCEYCPAQNQIYWDEEHKSE